MDAMKADSMRQIRRCNSVHPASSFCEAPCFHEIQYGLGLLQAGSQFRSTTGVGASHWENSMSPGSGALHVLRSLDHSGSIFELRGDESLQGFNMWGNCSLEAPLQIMNLFRVRVLVLNVTQCTSYMCSQLTLTDFRGSAWKASFTLQDVHDTLVGNNILVSCGAASSARRYSTPQSGLSHVTGGLSAGAGGGSAVMDTGCILQRPAQAYQGEREAVWHGSQAHA